MKAQHPTGLEGSGPLSAGPRLLPPQLLQSPAMSLGLCRAPCSTSCVLTIPTPTPHPTPHKEELPSLRGHHLHAAVRFPEPKITTLFSQEIEKPQNVLFKRSGIQSFTGSTCQLGVRNSQASRNTCLGTVVTGLCSASLHPEGFSNAQVSTNLPKAALSQFLSVHLTSHRLTFKRVCCRECVGSGPAAPFK